MNVLQKSLLAGVFALCSFMIKAMEEIPSKISKRPTRVVASMSDLPRLIAGIKNLRDHLKDRGITIDDSELEKVQEALERAQRAPQLWDAYFALRIAASHLDIIIKRHARKGEVGLAKSERLMIDDIAKQYKELAQAKEEAAKKQ